MSVVYCGNDGGIFRCTSGVNFTSLNGGGFQAALFYNLDVKPDATASVTLGALQDNGIVTTAGAVAPTWKMGAGGDGFDVAHDGQNATQAYGRSNSTILRSTNDGVSYGGISPPWPAAEVGVFLAAVATDPNANGGVYASSNQNLWQSTDGGSTWPNKVAIPGTASEVDVAPTNSNNVVVTVGGRVLVSTDALVAGGLTLNDITRNLPGRFVGGVAFDPNDPATIYAVLGGFSGFPGGHVFRTSLTATTWTDISPPIDLPFNAIAVDGSETPTALYTGTDFGVLRSVDGGASWSVLDDIHFPGAPVFELVYHQGELRVATFGRGRLFLRKANRSVDRSQPRAQPRIRHGLPRSAIPDARSLQRRSVGSRHHERTAPDGFDRILRARYAGHAARHRGGRACRLHRALRPWRALPRRPRPSAS